MDGHQKQREQSARMIEEALFALMEEKSYARITVSEIVKRADVARRTFYRLYREKDDVLHCYFGRLCRAYCQQAPVLQNYNIRQIAEEYFAFWYQHRKILQLLQKCGLDRMLYYEISRVSSDVVKSRIGGKECKDVTGIEYFAAYSTGGFILLLQRWIMTGMRETPKQYAEAVSEALLRFISCQTGN